MLPGLSGLLYSLIEKNLLKAYEDYKLEEQRKQQQTREEAQSEQQLVELIREVAGRDSQNMAGLGHSDLYYAKDL